MWVGSGVLGCLQNTAPVTLSRTQSRLNVNIILAKKNNDHTAMFAMKPQKDKFVLLGSWPWISVLIVKITFNSYCACVTVCSSWASSPCGGLCLCVSQTWLRLASSMRPREDNWCVLLAPGTRRATKQITGSPNGQRSNFHYLLHIEAQAIINIRIALDKFQSKHSR